MTRKCRTRCEHMLRQTSESFPEIDSPGMRFIARLFRLRDVIFENAQREMAEFELSPAEYSVLATLRKTPAPHRLKPSDIYKGMLLSSGGLSKVLKTLEERGLVLREDDQDDRRGSLVRLSPAGVELSERAMKAVIGSDIAMLNRVADTARLDALAEALKPFTESLDR
ncbi:MAG: MarR family transcriptional regulator [Rhodocyclaceae bacterium]|nr:MarR family transcriptional regulator [Rhodocyclaceae bacterium]MCP5232609.1 MarR family transcriptional regulator [Zoogloeaceae bacterium]MCP5240710.1 MarR family transcriptional regulator [Zoogloeaceae bacterium]MCP5253178.1 MarR family transcriptional regulator [Zoogloeaceae bacterium]MCP5293435.1 MarR family transcriptional regulator [Zoogloeaceae bacterium]